MQTIRDGSVLSQAPTSETRVDLRITIRRGAFTAVIHTLGTGDAGETIRALAERAIEEAQR